LLSRKFSSILLLIIFCNSFFYYTWFYFSIIKAKIEALGAIANCDVEKTSIKIPVAELQKDESDEAWYNNKLYDVAKRESVNDTEYIYLLRDEEEQDVLNDNSDYFKNDPGAFLSSGYRLNSQKKAPVITDDNYFISAEKNISFFGYLFKPPTVKNKYCFISFCTDVPTPPPRKASMI
jgi:hypothetical protein